MPVVPYTDAVILGKMFAELARDRDLPIRGVWVRQFGHIPELWVITEPMSLAEERPIHQAKVDLRGKASDAVFDFRLINPSWWSQFEAEQVIPNDAKTIVA